MPSTPLCPATDPRTNIYHLLADACFVAYVVADSVNEHNKVNLFKYARLPFLNSRYELISNIEDKAL